MHTILYIPLCTHAITLMLPELFSLKRNEKLCTFGIFFGLQLLIAKIAKSRSKLDS